MSRTQASRLAIYLTRDCPACATARMVADDVTRARPDIQVALIYLEDGESPPPPVFGVPTYMWHGRVVSLGNPYLDDLLTLLHDADVRGTAHAVHDR